MKHIKLFEQHKKTEKPKKNLGDLELNNEQIKIICDIINRFGGSQHPYCDNRSIRGFYISYLQKILNKNHESIYKNLSTDGREILNNIIEKLPDLKNKKE